MFEINKPAGEGGGGGLNRGFTVIESVMLFFGNEAFMALSGIKAAIETDEQVLNFDNATLKGKDTNSS